MGRARRAIKAFGLGDEWEPLTTGSRLGGRIFDRVVVLAPEDATQKFVYLVHRVGLRMRTPGEYPVVL